MHKVMTGLASGLSVAGLVLSGCGGSAEPQPLPQPTKQVSPSASATPPVMPAAAKEKTKAGAIAMVEHFLKALNYSGGAGDTAPLRASYIELCTRCEALADGIDKTYTAGGYYEGGNWLPRKVKFYKIDGDVATLDARVSYTEQEWLRREGDEPVKYGPSDDHLHAFQLKWVPARGWRVGALDPQL